MKDDDPFNYPLFSVGDVARMFAIVTILALIALLVAYLVLRPALARDDGRYANSPLKSWFDSLRSGKGPCCSVADGRVVDDPDWTTKDGHYRVQIDGEWVDVPDDALITEPNRAERTMVWPTYQDGHPHVRCFLPGSMT